MKGAKKIEFIHKDRILDLNRSLGEYQLFDTIIKVQRADSPVKNYST